jgi:glycosyltransferase 2 family protein
LTALRALKWLLFAAVLAFVCRHGYELWIQNPESQGVVRRAFSNPAAAGWLIASGVIYLLGWLPSVWFWRELMRAIGGRVAFCDAARAYYCGHLGKYVPGKAMVLVIRAAMVKDRGCRALPAAVAVTYETLTMMGTGLAVGVALGPILFSQWLAANAPGGVSSPVAATAIAFLLVLVVISVSLPFVSRLLTWIAIKATPGGAVTEGGGLEIPQRLIAAGCLAFVVSWAIQGLSLGLVLRAVGVAPLQFADWPTWTGATALSTSLGFAVLFAPGGLGVREGILLGILTAQPQVGAAAAVGATVLSRVVSFAAEVLLSAVLYWMVPRRALTSASPGQTPL